MRRLLVGAGAVLAPRRRHPGRTCRPSPPTRRTTCWCSPRPPASGTTRSPPASRRSATWARPTTSPSTATEDATAFTTANLAQYKAVVFLSTTGDVLNATQQTAFESYIRGGGGYVGVHSAADTEYDWPFYGSLVGAYFASPPGDPAGQRPDREPGPPGDGAPAAGLDPHRRAVQLPHQPALHRPRPGHPGRVDLQRRHDGRRPPDHLVPDATTAAGRSTPASATARRPTPSRRFRAAAARRHPVRRQAGQRRLPPGDRLHARCTTARPPAGPRPARAASPTPTPPSPRPAAWACSGTPPSSSARTRSRLDWRMTGDSNSGVLVGFPNPGNDPNVAHEPGLRGPDRRHRQPPTAPRARSTASRPPTSPPATRR